MHERLVKPSNGGVGRGHERRGDDRSTHQIAKTPNGYTATEDL